jgi:hypothetical protein
MWVAPFNGLGAQMEGKRKKEATSADLFSALCFLVSMR